jgi:hypothetical protein
MLNVWAQKMAQIAGGTNPRNTTLFLGEKTAPKMATGYILARCREDKLEIPVRFQSFCKKDENMLSRLITCIVNPTKLNEFKNALNNQFLPRIQAQPGFIENIESLDPATGQFSCMTLWKTATARHRSQASSGGREKE